MTVERGLEEWRICFNWWLRWTGHGYE